MLRSSALYAGVDPDALPADSTTRLSGCRRLHGETWIGGDVSSAMVCVVPSDTNKQLLVYRAGATADSPLPSTLYNKVRLNDNRCTLSCETAADSPLQFTLCNGLSINLFPSLFRDNPDKE